MLFQINKNVNKHFLYDYIKDNNSFFVFNIRNFQEKIYVFKYFGEDVLHIKQVINVYDEDIFLNLFSGNLFFCFIESNEFLNKLVNLYFYNLSEIKLDLVGICYNNFFLNFNFNFVNILNCLFLNFSIMFFLILIYINLFFFKIVLLLKKNLSKKKC